MNNIFEMAAFCLQNSAIDPKLEMTRLARELDIKGELDLSTGQHPLPVSTTTFPERPELLNPRRMPRRKFTTKQGTIAFFHAVAHIEFTAIYLAWDMIYRFRSMPDQFYHDWLVVAAEEAVHFSMLRDRLRDLEADYGDLPAHSGLWDIAEDTADSLLARLALVPRFMEAHGLDVTPEMINKCKAIDDQYGAKILTRILEDEVGHVKLGSYWFAFVCREKGVDPEKTYKEMVRVRLNGKTVGRINRKLRKLAGFSDAELDWLEKFRE